MVFHEADGEMREDGGVVGGRARSWHRGMCVQMFKICWLQFPLGQVPTIQSLWL